MMTNTLGWLIEGEWLSGSLAALLGAGFRGVLLLAVVLAAAAALQAASAATRHALLGAGLLVVLLMPFGHLVPWRLPVLPVGGQTTPRLVDAIGNVDSGEALGLSPIVDRAPVLGAEVEAPSSRLSDQGVAERGRAGSGGPVTDGSLVGGARLEQIANSPEARAGTPVASGSTGEVTAAGTSSGGAGGPLANWAMLIAVWLLGMAVLAGRMLFGHWLAARLVARSETVTDPSWQALLWESADRLEIAKDVRLFWSDDAAMPFATGLLKPAIVLPREADGWDEDRRRAVLMHELAHIRRGDLLLHHVGRWACLLYWFNPLVWLAARRLRAESERAADDLVLSVGTLPSAYADHLLQIVAGARRVIAPEPVLPLARRREFEGRILAILEPHLPRKQTSRLHAALLNVAIALLALPLVALAPADAVVGGDDPLEMAMQSAVETTKERVFGSDPTQPDRFDEPLGASTIQSAPQSPRWDPRPPRAAEPSTPPHLPVGEAPEAPAFPDSPHGAKSSSVFASSAFGASAASDSWWASGAASAAQARGRDKAPTLRSEEFAEIWRKFVPGFALDALDGLGVNVSPSNNVQVQVDIDRDEDVDVQVDRHIDEDIDVQVDRHIDVDGVVDSEVENEIENEFEREFEEFEQEIDRLVENAASVGVQTRLGIVDVLGDSDQDPRAIAALIRLLGSDPVPEVRLAAARALGDMEAVEAVPALGSALRQDADFRVRAAAARALGEIEDPGAVEPLIDAMSDENPEVRRAAIDALDDLDSTLATPGYVVALSDANVEVRRRAAMVLGDQDLQSAPPELINALSDADPGVRAAAARSLGEIEDPAAANALGAVLNDANPQVRNAALEALVEMESPLVIDALIQALESEDPAVRLRATEALREFN